MQKKVWVIALVIAVLALTISRCSTSRKPDYSADVVATTNGYTSTYKIYVSGKKDRIEGDLCGRQQISIFDRDNYVAYILLPDQKIAQVMKLKSVQAYETVFGDFEKRLGRDVKREKVGPDYVEGILCDKYKLTQKTSRDEYIFYAWYSKEGITVKQAAEDGSWSTELRNLVIDRQPPFLFEVPADYQQVEVTR